MAQYGLEIKSEPRLEPITAIEPDELLFLARACPIVSNKCTSFERAYRLFFFSTFLDTAARLSQTVTALAALSR